jgi:putative redox protein
MASVIVSHVPGTAYQTRIETEEQTFIGDEPVASGGDGLGPSPYELLLASLGHCAVLTILLYARRKNWPVDRVAVRARHERVVIDDEVNGQASKRKLERIVQEISLAGDLNDEQRSRLLEVAGKCPVHRTLTGGLEIVDVEAVPVVTEA